MTKEEDFKLLKIQTCVLKVNIHCDGCRQKVNRILQRTEGVFQVHIDAEQQKVTVSGSVDAATLIKILVRAGKHAELWSQKTNQNQNQKQNNNCIKDDKNKKGQKLGIKGLEAFKNQHKFPAFSFEEDEDYFEDEEEDDEEEELRLHYIRENMLRQQAFDATNNAKKGVGAIAAASNNVGNAGKKGNPNQSMGMKASPGGIDPKTMAALKMNTLHLGGGGANINAGEVKRANDLSSLMSQAGFHGNGINVSSSAAVAAALGGNSNGLGGFQVQSNNGFQGSSAGFPTGGYATAATGQYPSSMMMNMNAYNHPSPLMMNMNMQNRHPIQQQQQQQQQQPQMMYHRSPFVPPSTGYYYNPNPNSNANANPYPNPIPYPYPYPNPTPTYSYVTEPSNYSGHSSAAHMFSDENTDSCSIM